MTGDLAAARLGTAVNGFSGRMDTLTADDLDRSTPCTEWTVRDLVNHVVGEMLWIPPLLDGLTIADVGDRLDGDHLGADARTAWTHAAAAATSSATALADPEQIVHLSYGDVPAHGYLDEAAIDVVVHTWDLARALDVDDRLDPDLVDHALAQLEGKADLLASSGMFAPPVPVGPDADPQTRLLAALGRG